MVNEQPWITMDQFDSICTHYGLSLRCFDGEHPQWMSSGVIVSPVIEGGEATFCTFDASNNMFHEPHVNFYNALVKENATGKYMTNDIGLGGCPTCIDRMEDLSRACCTVMQRIKWLEEHPDFRPKAIQIYEYERMQVKTKVSNLMAGEEIRVGFHDEIPYRVVNITPAGDPKNQVEIEIERLFTGEREKLRVSPEASVTAMRRAWKNENS